jgi:hypothetical protein
MLFSGYPVDIYVRASPYRRGATLRRHAPAKKIRRIETLKRPARRCFEWNRAQYFGVALYPSRPLIEVGSRRCWNRMPFADFNIHLRQIGEGGHHGYM